MEVSGLVPNFYIHVSVSDLYIPRICLPIWLQQIGNWETEHYNSAFEIARLRSFISGILTGPSFAAYSMSLAFLIFEA